MPQDIFSLSAEGFWFASIFIVNMMFCHVGNDLISEHENKLIIEGNLEMSMSLWQQLVLIPTTMKITNKHKLAPFARAAISDQLSSSSNDVDIISFHICLLLHASMEILEKCSEKNVGPSTMAVVKKWFDLMSMTAKSSLFSEAKDSVKTEFKDLLDHLEEDILDIEDSIGRQEHPYFSHEILFIRIAHMICFYCKNNLTAKFPSWRHAPIQANDNDMSKWESLSGELFKEIFSLDCFVTDSDYFSFLELPYQELEQCISSESPSVGHMHVKVLEAIHNYMQSHIKNSLKSDWESEAPEMEENNVIAYTFFCENYRSKFNGRKKQRTHYMKNRNPANQYKAKQKYLFHRDLFVMGTESYFFKGSIPNAKAIKKFQLDYPVQNELDGESDEATAII